MKKMLLLLVLVPMFAVLQAQEYQFFNDDFTVFMEDDGYLPWVFPYNTLSAEYVDGRKYYEFQGMLNYVDEMFLDANGPGFLGEHAMWDTAQGLYVLFNRYDDSIRIYTNRDVGDSWIAYTKENDTVWAEVTSKTTDITKSGDPETVKTVTFIYPENISGFDGSVHNKSITFGSSSGLISFFNIVVFPGLVNEDYGDIPTFYKAYESNQITSDAFDPAFIDSISDADLFDWYPGDELHTKYFGCTGSEPDISTIDTWIIKKVLNRIDSANNIALTFHRKYKRWRNDTVIDQAIDTIIRTYSKTPLDVIPPYRYEGDEFRADVAGLRIKNHRIAVVKNYLSIVKDGEYWTILPFKSDKYSYYETEGICGLGGWYYDNTGTFCDPYNRFVYYKMGDSEVGTPLDFEVTGMQEISVSDIKIYPNPVRDVLYIEMEKTNGTNTVLEIWNASGQIVLKDRIQKQTAINVHELSTGLYFYRIMNEAGMVTSGKILKE